MERKKPEAKKKRWAGSNPAFSFVFSLVLILVLFVFLVSKALVVPGNPSQNRARGYTHVGLRCCRMANLANLAREEGSGFRLPDAISGSPFDWSQPIRGPPYLSASKFPG